MSYQDLIKAAQDVVSHFNNIGYGLGLVNRIGILEEVLENEALTEPISFSAITQALDYEIEWSKGNVHLAPNQNEVDWFVKGLEQAKWLILEIAKLDPPDDLSTLEPKEDLPTGTPGYMGDYGGIPHGPFDI